MCPTNRPCNDLVEVQVIGEQWQEGDSATACLWDIRNFRAKVTSRRCCLRWQCTYGNASARGHACAYITDLSLPGGWADDEGFGHRQTRYYLYHRFEIERPFANQSPDRDQFLFACALTFVILAEFAEISPCVRFCWAWLAASVISLMSCDRKGLSVPSPPCSRQRHPYP